MKHGLLIIACFMLTATGALACDKPVSVCIPEQPDAPHKGFELIRQGQPVPVYIDKQADPAVRHVARSFVSDLERVGDRKTLVFEDMGQAKGNVVIIGVIGQSPVIDGLIKAGKIQVTDLKGQWEAYQQAVVENPAPNVPRALVIVGSDRRGAVFGTYDISEKIGVSPWHWWADVPVMRHQNLFITEGRVRDQPRVKYRGFFINDEEPALGPWARARFGGLNARFYEHVFELNLRLKGNYLWPAMWGKAFYDDDPQNGALADEMGIVMGTSHHEPMTRAQDEWHRHKDSGITGGKWDYTTNSANLRAFWRGGIERMMTGPGKRPRDTLVTIGMRGDGDEPMSEGTATALLETIVADQRRIITEVTGKPASEIPQVWALYKEVQDYYDHGMKVPDDVLLLFADDNWGQIRRLPERGSTRKGGYGVYYHFDYVGGPRNYKWLNTNQIEKTWQQMNLAWDSGARDLWIVNVGDIKPMEYPLSFFMEMAWNPEAMTPQKLEAFPKYWALKTFGAQGENIAPLLTRYSQLAARRKPELTDMTSYSRFYGERVRVQEETAELAREVGAVRAGLPKVYDDAFMQVLGYPATALANVNALYFAVAMNRAYGEVGSPAANIWADIAEKAFEQDAALSDDYNKRMSDGKWNHMMDQVRIGYTSWQQPARNLMPEVKRIAPKATSDLAFGPAGDQSIVQGRAWEAELYLDRYDASPKTIGLTHPEAAPVQTQISGAPSWLKTSEPSTRAVAPFTSDYRLQADWAQLPLGISEGIITLTTPQSAPLRVKIIANNPPLPKEAKGSVEAGGVVAVEAQDFTRSVVGKGISWQVVPHLGRAVSAVLSMPQAAPSTTVADNVRLDYDVTLTKDADTELSLFLLPTLDTRNQGGLKLAVSIDDRTPQVLTLNLKPDTQDWTRAVTDNGFVLKARFPELKTGPHTIRVWRLDGNVVLERLVLDTGGLKPSVMGPPASPRLQKN